MRYQPVTGFDGDEQTVGPFETIRFRLDVNEIDNDVDDDGDGVVDDGVVVQESAGGEIIIAANVLEMSVTATAVGVRIEVAVGGVDGLGESLRRELSREVCFRNPG